MDERLKVIARLLDEEQMLAVCRAIHIRPNQVQSDSVGGRQGRPEPGFDNGYEVWVSQFAYRPPLQGAPNRCRVADIA